MDVQLPPLDVIPLPEEVKGNSSTAQSVESDVSNDRLERKQEESKDDDMSSNSGEKKTKLDAKTLLNSVLEKQRPGEIQGTESRDGDNTISITVSGGSEMAAASSKSQTIVDELFKDFLAFKIQQDEKLKQRGVKMTDSSQLAHSMEEMSKLLDEEINLLLHTQKSQKRDSHSPSYKKKKKKHEHRHHDERKSYEDRKERKHKHDEKDGRDGDRKKRREDDERRDKNDCKREKGRESRHDREKHPEMAESGRHQTTLDKVKKDESSKLLNEGKEEHRTSDQTHSEILQASGESNKMLESVHVAAAGHCDKLKQKSEAPDDKITKCAEPGAVNVAEEKGGVYLELQKKNLGLKVSISEESTARIVSGQSGDCKKSKPLEDGEVSSTSTNSSDSDASDDDDVADGIPSGSGSLSESDRESRPSKSKKKKKKKHRHKKKKKYRSKDKSVKEEKKDKSRSDEKTRSKSRSKSPHRGYRSRSRSCERRSRNTSRTRSPGHRRRSRSHSLENRSRSRSHERRREKYGYDEWDARYYGKGDHNGKHRSRSRSKSRSRSRSRSRDRWQRHERKSSREERDLRLKIDKAKLRKIAMANVLKKMQSGEEITGVDPATINMIKAGGKSVEELTEYCKKLSEREKSAYSSSDSDIGHKSDSEDDSLIHHPFVVKDPSQTPNIVLNIRNSRQLPVRTPQEKATESAQLRLQFPVSSGTSHRAKEGEWVPVPRTTAPAPQPSTSMAAASSVGINMNMRNDVGSMVRPPVGYNTPPGTVPPSLLPTPPPPPPPPPPPAADPRNKVFPDPPQKAIDIGSVISERLLAARKLATNPYDVEALSAMHQVQEKASRWAESKHLPGQFVGSTGAQILTPQELTSGDKRCQPWAKKDLFKRAAPVQGGIGMFLLQKMGWKQGEGLGKGGGGSLEPLMLDVKSDRKGLQSQGEGTKKVPPIRMPVPAAKDLSGKHPVSALTELCNKRRWGPPNFVCIHESGPDHKKNFLFKVIVNNVEYQPSVTSVSKKLAKAQAARTCLQELGLIPKIGSV